MNDSTPPQLNALDRAIAAVAPTWAARRFAARIAIWQDNRALTSSYRGGVTTRMDRGFAASDGQRGVNHPLSQATLTNLRDRSRALDRENTLFSSALDRAVENIVGRDVALQVRTSDNAWNTAVEKRWARWADEEADIRGMEPLSELLRMDQRAVFRDGDVGMILVDRGGRPVLQAVEGDMIESPTGWKSNIIDGIELSSFGRPLAFHVKSYDQQGVRSDYARVPGGSFIFELRRSRHSQVRGEPVAAQAFWLFDHIDGWIEGTVSSMRAGACQALIIEKNNAGKIYGSLQKTTSDSEGNSDRKKLSLEPLSINYVEPGESVKGFTPTQPGQNFEGALTALARMLGLNMGLAVEQTMLDYSRVSYLSSRAMRLQADATANVWRDRLVKRKLRRLFRWWIDRMIALGELPAGSEEERYAHEWVFEPRAWVDPDKDIKAALMELDMGLTTLDKLCKERGAEFAENIAKRAEERRIMVEAGLPLVMSTATREEGANQPAETTKENPNETTSEEDDDADDAADDE